MKSVRFLFLGLLAICGSALAANALEEAPAEDSPRYEIVPWTNGWHAAKADAEARGGHLATITSGEEWRGVTRTFSPEELTGCWLGASDEETEDTWKWVTGEPMGYVRWAGVEPNNDRGNPEGQENYLVVDDRWGIIHWNDVYEQCSEATKYLLEREGENLLPRIPRKCGTAFLPSAAPIDPGKNGLAVSFYDTGNQELPYPAWMASHGSMLEWFAAMTPTLSTNTAYVGEHFDFGCNDPNLEGVHGPCRFPGKYALRGTDAFAALFRGNIDIPEAGTYRFEALGDNGSVLYIDGQPVFGAVGNVNFYSGKRGGTKVLSAGVHEFALAFFEQDQYQGLKLYWQPPSATKPVLLPQSVLSRPQDVPASVAAPAGLGEGLVAYWPCDGDAKDASGNGNDGVLHGAVAAADRNGKAGGALYFDGIDDSVVVPGTPSLDITNAITIAVWAKLDSARSILSVCDKNGESWRLQLYSWNPAELGNDQTAIHFAGSLPAGKWVHVAATFDGSVAKVYLNGTEAGHAARSAPFPSSASDVHIGSDPFLQKEYFAGSLDDLAVWNRALSAEEVAKLCLDATPPPRVRTVCSNLPPIRVSAPVVAPAGLHEGLVAYWPCDGNAKDASGNGNNGVLHGAIPTPDRNGKSDGALWFDGRSTVRVADSASLRDVTNAFTVAAWVKYDKPCTIVDSWVTTLSKGTEGRQFGLNFNLTAPAANNTEIGLFQHAAFRAFPEKGVWTHVAATFDANGRSTAYVNGKAVGTWSSPRLLSVNREELVIGADPHGDAEYLFGALDDVAVWNRALSAEEVAKLAASAEEAAPVNPPRYEIVPWRKGWQAAKADAEARGGHLATVTSAEEWETIRKLFPLRDLLGCWLGASDAEEEGIWQWVTGEPWGFTRWAPDQPDAMREGQDFLWLHVNFAGHWDDIEGNDPGATKYLLEREGPPISVSGLRQPFRLSPQVLRFEAAGGTNEVEVAAEGAWAAAERVPWISLKHAHGNGPGRLAVKVAANGSPAKRSAKVRVRTTWDGEWRDIAVEQRGMEQVATPRVRPRGGGTFAGPKQRVVLSCATEGAAIRYTLDGCDPDGTSPLYAGSFNLSATATVKARAFKDGMLPSGPAEASFRRRTSLAEALGMPEGTVSTDRFTGWRVDEGAGREGGSAAKSGAIGPEGRSRMEVRIEGAGTVAFWWKASCEDDPDGTGWDRVAFSVDGLEKAALDGESGWQRVEAEVKGEGVHILAWEYAKDWIDEKVIADAAWVEGVSWRAATKRQVRSKE
jgi:hypothetical protein